MNVSKELLERAKTAKTEEELLAMAKEENIELTEEEAAKYFAELHKTGELSDDELNNVSGGGLCGEPDFKYDYGNRVLFRTKSSGDTLTGVIYGRQISDGSIIYLINEERIEFCASGIARVRNGRKHNVPQDNIIRLHNDQKKY